MALGWMTKPAGPVLLFDPPEQPGLTVGSACLLNFWFKPPARGAARTPMH